MSKVKQYEGSELATLKNKRAMSRQKKISKKNKITEKRIRPVKPPKREDETPSLRNIRCLYEAFDLLEDYWPYSFFDE